MNKSELKAAIESLLFASRVPLTINDLKKLLKVEEEEPEKKEEVVSSEGGVPPPVDSESDPALQLKQMQEIFEQELSTGEIKKALFEIMDDYHSQTDRGIELLEIAGGYQFRTKASLARYVRNLNQVPKQRLSTPAMETLSIIAYQQPVTRQKLEQIRGVDSGGVVKTLLDRDLIRVVGRSEEPGRPIIYGTSAAFLEVFGLASLSDMPTLKDLEALEGVSPDYSEGAEMAEPSESIAIETEETNYFYSDEESDQLLDDLENSVRSLKDLEKSIFPKSQEEIVSISSEALDSESKKEGHA